MVSKALIPRCGDVVEESKKMSTKDEILVDRKNPKWWQVEANAGQIELTLGPGHVTPGNVKKLTNRFGLSNVRVRFGHFWATTYTEYSLGGEVPSVTKECRSCGSQHEVPLWDVVKEKREWFSKYGMMDRRQLRKEVTLHATVPKESFEPFYRFMIPIEAGNELPRIARALLKEATSRGGSK